GGDALAEPQQCPRHGAAAATALACGAAGRSPAGNVATPRRVAGGAGDLRGGEERSARGERAGRRHARDPLMLAAPVRAQRTEGERSELRGAPRARAPQRSRRSRPPRYEHATLAARRGDAGRGAAGSADCPDMSPRRRTPAAGAAGAARAMIRTARAIPTARSLRYIPEKKTRGTPSWDVFDFPFAAGRPCCSSRR